MLALTDPRFSRSLLLSALALGLWGCAQTTQDGAASNPRQPRDAFTAVASNPEIKESSDCASNSLLKGVKKETSSKRVKTGQRASFFDSNVIGKRASLQNPRVNGPFLELSVNVQGEFEEFEGAITQTFAETKFEASPGTALIGHTLTAGILLMLSPVNSLQHAFGCTDIKMTESGIYREDARATGATQWSAIQDDFDFDLEVEAFGVKKRWRTSGDNRGPLRVDFTKELLDHVGSPIQPIRITCFNCNARQARDQAGVQASAPTPVTVSTQADFSVHLAAVARQKREDEERVAAARAAALARAEAEARKRLTGSLDSALLRALPWKERLDRAVHLELRRWMGPPDGDLQEIAPPVYPAALSLRQETWETNEEFERRVNAARAERGRIIDRIQAEYRARVEERNKRVADYNSLRQEREPKLAEYRRFLIMAGLNHLSPSVMFSDAALDQQSGALTLSAQVDSLGRQNFSFFGTNQIFRRAVLSNAAAVRARPHFQVNQAGEISLQALTVEAGGTSARGEPSSGSASPVQLASVTIASAPAPMIAQQSAVTVDRNQVEQILYREENENLRKRLEDQRRQQEQALARAEARAAAEIARIRAEADAERKKLAQTRPMQNLAAVQEAHALVIGNSAYPGNNRLANPVNDAAAISAQLRSLGFKVTEISNASREQMVRGLSEFNKSAARADLTLLFYAGHGVQIQGVNYMVPVDMSLTDPSQVTLQAVSLTQVVEQYLPGKTKLVFLDACRDNPLMSAGLRGVSKGLAPIAVSEGTLIAYATKDGQTAEDGVGQPNSPFTAALLEHLADPEDIGIILRTVRSKVMQRTNNRQQPWEYGSLTGGALVLSSIKSQN